MERWSCFLYIIPYLLLWCDNADQLALKAPPSNSLLSVVFEMLYQKASHDAYGMASAFTVEESVMLKLLMIGKFQ